MNVQDIKYFDPDDEYTIIERKLPHWSQPGAMCFITWRTNDSMPQNVIEAWYQERRDWLSQRGLNCPTGLESQMVEKLSVAARREFNMHFSNRWHQQLDQGFGKCVLARPELAAIVTSSLHHFDGSRYILTDFVVMPNHVHLLAAFVDEGAMLNQCESWKRFTATAINKVLGVKGRFWQQDGFDHLVRSESQYQYLRKYIRENPVMANLKAGSYVHHSKDALASSR